MSSDPPPPSSPDQPGDNAPPEDSSGRRPAPSPSYNAPGAARRLKSSLVDELAALEAEIAQPSAKPSAPPSASDVSRSAAADPAAVNAPPPQDEPIVSAASPRLPEIDPTPAALREDLPAFEDEGRRTRQPVASASGEPSWEETPNAGAAREAGDSDASSGAVSAPTTRRKLTVAEVAGLLVMALILTGGAVFLLRGPTGAIATGADASTPARAPSTPARGELVTVTEIDAYWRDRTDADRVDASEMILPEIRVRITPPEDPATIFLKIHFLDPEGQIAGDVRTARIDNGGLVSTSRGETILDETTFTVASSRGFPDKTTYQAYRFGEDRRWAVEIFEGADYAKGPWNRIAYFEVPTDHREGGTAARP